MLDKGEDGNKIFIEETERKPNRYAASVLAGVVVVIALACTLNETGVFKLDKLLMRICLVFALGMFFVMQVIAHNEKMLANPLSKYLVMGMVIILVLTATVLLNIHAVLAFVLPLLLATQYRSHRISRFALVGSMISCALAPILSFLLDTWSLNFLKGYIEVFCHVTITATAGNAFTASESLWQIFLYWSLPQMLILGAFGIILLSVTNSEIASVENQIRVVELSKDLQKQLESITSMQEKVLYAMSDIIENRDIETGGHVRRTIEVVSALMNAIARDPNSGVSEKFCREVIKSAPMHDLGKISIPDAILHKTGKLTVEEYEIVKRHPVDSARIISEALTGIEDEQLLSVASNIALYHHERMDGNGYPKHLRGEEIPLEARVMAIADVYDALVSKRCYKEPMSFEDAFSTIESSMGTQFDPKLNRYFVACREEIEALYRNN